MCGTGEITSWFTDVCYEHWLNAPDSRLDIDGEAFEVLDDDGLRALGEDPLSPTVPLIIRRDSDHQCFQVEFDVVAWPTSREERDAQRERGARLAASRQQGHAQAGGQGPAGVSGCQPPHDPDERCFDCATDDEMAAAVSPQTGD